MGQGWVSKHAVHPPCYSPLASGIGTINFISATRHEIMRVNRSKFIRKYLRFFRVVFGFAPRFNVKLEAYMLAIACLLSYLICPPLLFSPQVILDSNFIFAGLKYKIDIRERLQKLLQHDDVRIFSKFPICILVE